MAGGANAVYSVTRHPSPASLPSFARLPGRRELWGLEVRALPQIPFPRLVWSANPAVGSSIAWFSQYSLESFLPHFLDELLVLGVLRYLESSLTLV